MRLVSQSNDWCPAAMCMAVLSSPPLPLSSFLISYGSTREFKCREYKGIRNLFAEEGEKKSSYWVFFKLQGSVKSLMAKIYNPCTV